MRNVKKFVVWDINKAKLVTPRDGTDKTSATAWADTLEARNDTPYMVLPA